MRTRNPLFAGPDLAGRRVLVVGFGTSGRAALRLLTARGAVVTVNDRRSETELGPAADEARAAGATLVCDGHPAELARDFDLLVVSPGVGDNELLSAARMAGVPVWGEVELAARHCVGRIIAITGSNGKSTTTAMIGAILRSSGIRGGTGGNLAIPFSDLLAEDGPDAVHALELSSFQLETLASLRPTVALVLNLSPDHLDRYASLDDYAQAKARLLALQDPGDDAVLNADDKASDQFRKSVRGRLATFSTRGPVERGAWLEHGRLTLDIGSGVEPLLAAAELPLPGEHNTANALAAGLATRLIGCPIESISGALRSFPGLAHRLERVAEIRGVTFYNDSKGTNPDSTLRALAAFPVGCVQLILGGREKGADWGELLATIERRQVPRVLLVGAATPLLARLLTGRVPFVECQTVAAAAREGFAGAKRGQIVLLSPGCASYDQYQNFEERGEDFRGTVAAIAGENADA